MDLMRALEKTYPLKLLGEEEPPASNRKAGRRTRGHGKTRFVLSRLIKRNTPRTGSVCVPSQVAEEFRTLRDRLLLSHAGHELKTIAVCKANGGEGSSTVACHLALAFANDPRMRVVLVDSDLHHPSLHAMLRVSQENGLYEILAEGAATTKERIKKTMLHNLYVITSGDPLSLPSISFDPRIFTEVLENLKTEFSIVLIDTPPTLADDCTALAMAAQCDGVILVVQAEQTRWKVAQEAQAQLRRAGAKFLGVVLNKRIYPIPEFLYKRL